jgi:ubiquitin-like protein Pup
MAQTKTTKTKAPTKTKTAPKPKAPTKLVDMIDDILDEIDTVLEDACVARTYVQKGGE